MAKSTYSSISQRTNTWAATEMLAHAEPVLCLSKFGLTKPIPKNSANNVKFRRPVVFPYATTPLTEGTTPASRAMAYEDVTVTLAQYGDVVEITDHVEDLAEDPVLKDASEQCGVQAGGTIEQITWNAIKGGTNVNFANGSARNAVNTQFTLAIQRKATRTLKANKALPVRKMVTSSVKYDTQAIAPAFIAFAHTDVEGAIRDLVGFVPAEKYGSEMALPYEIGKCEDVRYIVSPELGSIPDAGGAKGAMISTTGTSADVYPVIIMGQDAFGCVPLKGMGSIKPKITPVDATDSSDPLGQRGFVGWKTYFAALILNDAWMVRVETAAVA